MANGRLGVAIPVINTNTSVYIVPSSCKYAKVNVFILNPTSGIANVEVAVALTGTPNDNEYIDKGSDVPALGGSLEITDLICSPGENIIVKTDKADTIVRVSGMEII